MDGTVEWWNNGMVGKNKAQECLTLLPNIPLFQHSIIPMIRQ